MSYFHYYSNGFYRPYSGGNPLWWGDPGPLPPFCYDDDHGQREDHNEEKGNKNNGKGNGGKNDGWDIWNRSGKASSQNDAEVDNQNNVENNDESEDEEEQQENADERVDNKNNNGKCNASTNSKGNPKSNSASNGKGNNDGRSAKFTKGKCKGKSNGKASKPHQGQNRPGERPSHEEAKSSFNELPEYEHRRSPFPPRPNYSSSTTFQPRPADKKAFDMSYFNPYGGYWVNGANYNVPLNGFNSFNIPQYPNRFIAPRPMNPGYLNRPASSSDGYPFLNTTEVVKLHLLTTEVAPWEIGPSEQVTFQATTVPACITIGELMTDLGAHNQDPRKNVCYEVHQGSDGRWFAGLSFTAADKDLMKKTLRDIGWDSSRNGRRAGKPIICLYLTKD